MAQLKNLLVTGAGRVIGKLYASAFSGNGAELTSLNASNVSSGTLSADRLATSGATAGSYGDSGSTRTVSNGDTFSIPYVTVDAKGRVTSASTKTMTLNAAGSNAVVLSSTEPTNDDCVIWVQV